MTAQRRFIVVENERGISVTDGATDRASPPTRPFVAPLDSAALEELRFYVEDYVDVPFATYDERQRSIAARLPAYGEALFRALFGAESALERWLGEREARSPAEVWICSRSPKFLALPWELLKAPSVNAPLVLNGVSIVRSTEAPAHARTRVLDADCVRVLMVIARSKGDGVSYRSVAARLFHELERDGGRVAIHVLRPPTLGNLDQVLATAAAAERPYHVVHFDGHGSVEEKATRLVFANADGRPDKVSPEAITEVVRRHSIPVVILNACESGKITGSALEATAAIKLLHGGTSTVVAMGYEVQVTAAAHLLAALYTGLRQGRDIHACVSAGREQLAAQPLRPTARESLPISDWFVPVLYSNEALAFAPTIALPAVSARAADDRQIATRRFFGRSSEFLALEGAFARKQAVLIHGVIGIGKTSLAKEFAAWWIATQPDMQTRESFVVRHHGDLELTRDDTQRIASANLPRDSVVLIDQAGGVADASERASRGEPAEFARFLEWCASRELRVLITSRGSVPWLGSAVFRLDLQGLDGAAAHEYLQWLIGEHRLPRLDYGSTRYSDIMGAAKGNPHTLYQALLSPDPASPPGRNGVSVVTAGEAGAAVVEYDQRLSPEDAIASLPPSQREIVGLLSLFDGYVDAGSLRSISERASCPARFRGVSRDDWGALLGACERIGFLRRQLKLYATHPLLAGVAARLWASLAGAAFEGELADSKLAFAEGHAEFAGAMLDKVSRNVGAHQVIAVVSEAHGTLQNALEWCLELQRWDLALPLYEILDEFWQVTRDGQAARAQRRACRARLDVALAPDMKLDSPGGAFALSLAAGEAEQLFMEAELEMAQTRYEELRRLLEGRVEPEAVRCRRTVEYRLESIRIKRGKGRPAEEVELRAGAQGRGDENDDPSLVATRALRQGHLLLEHGEIDQARRQYEVAHRTFRELGDERCFAGAKLLGARIADGDGDFGTALSLIAEARTLLERFHDHQHLVLCDYQSSIVLLRGNSLEQAEKFAALALIGAETFGFEELAAAARHQLGLVAQARKRLDEARQWFERAAQSFDALNDPAGRRKSLLQLRGVLDTLGSSTTQSASLERKPLKA